MILVVNGNKENKVLEKVPYSLDISIFFLTFALELKNRLL